MKKIQMLGRNLSKTEQKVIKGGSEPTGGCPADVVGKSCYTWAFPQAGICYSTASSCVCKEKEGSVAAESLDCTNIA